MVLVFDLLQLGAHLHCVLPGPQESGLPEEDNTRAYPEAKRLEAQAGRHNN